MSNNNYKGCGCATGILRHFKPPYSSTFYVPCCIHDDDYDSARFPRKTADLRLYEHCCAVINRQPTSFSPFKRTIMTCVAFSYYLSVRLLGRFYYNKK